MASKIMRWNEVEWEDFHPQVSRKILMGENFMMVMYRFDKDLIWPPEKHVAEQGGYIVSGKVKSTVNGVANILGPGESYLIESNVLHVSEFLEETVLIDIFSPPRKYLLEEGKGFAPDRV
jgi:quercetin dioxygenase-like cupin family protein